MYGPVGARAAVEASQDTLALVLLARPRVRILRGLLGRHDDVLDLREPLGETLPVVLEKELLGTTDVRHLGLDEHEAIDVPVQELQAELEDIKLVIEHECIYEHL